MIAILLAGCAVRPEIFTAPLQSSHATFFWKHEGGTLSGDAELTSDAMGNLLLRLSGSRLLLECRSMADGKFYAAGPLAGGTWSGEASQTPLRLTLWTAMAAAWRDAQAAKEGCQEVHTATYSAAIRRISGKILEITVKSADNGEVIALACGAWRAEHRPLH